MVVKQPDPAAPSLRHRCVVPDKRLRAILRLARDRDGTDRLPIPAEHAAKEAERAAKEASLARIAELEAELARRPAR